MDDLFSVHPLRGRTLARADLEHLAAAPSPSHLVDCELEEADLSRLDLSGWSFERCNLRRTDFAGARLADTVWSSCRGAFAQFVGADLGEARFVASDFNNSAFRRAILTAARFERCKLTGADLSDARTLDIGFEETLLINAKLPGTSFRKQRLKQG